MSIDWYWIKQRPQIIAELLAKDYDITVAYYKEVFVKVDLRKDKDELTKSISIPAIPYRDKNRVAFFLQKFFWDKALKNIEQYDIVWLGHPLLYRYIPKKYSGKIIYDCMDNHIALANDKKIAKMVQKIEEKLVIRSNVVFASSNSLMKKIKNMSAEKKCLLVRNGFVSRDIKIPQKPEKKDKICLGYFGTIAEWMDFDTLLKSLDIFPELEYHFWGPVSNVQLPIHPRFIFEGVVEHQKLGKVVEDMDGLIMPFQVNDIIKVVDPVKLYEYISMGKTIITIFYDEIERFRPYVFFYKSVEEYMNNIKELIDKEFKPNYTEKQQLDFLRDNSWECRYETIILGIES